MALFERKQPEPDTRTFEEKFPLPVKVSKLIYGELKKGKLSINDIWLTLGHANDFKLAHVERIYNECKRLEGLINVMMRGEYLISAAEYKFDEEGNQVMEEFYGEESKTMLSRPVVLKEAVYFEPTDEKKLVRQLKAVTKYEIIDIALVTKDVRIWSDGNPDDEPSFADWAKTFKKE